MSTKASIPNLKQYVSSQIGKINATPLPADLKGSNLQTAKAHKAGYLEALMNIQNMLTRM
tara:strand:+ start:855 stop:1034 length:180 start_codon:yes stop_codon:yes gene_type:complete